MAGEQQAKIKAESYYNPNDAGVNLVAFLESAARKTALSAEDIHKSEFIENKLFGHAKKINPGAAETIPSFEIDRNAQFNIDAENYLLVAYKKLYGLQYHEKIAYIYNKQYPDADAHVKRWRAKPGFFYYAVCLKAGVFLKNVLDEIKAESSPSQNISENELKEKSKLRTERFSFIRNDEIGNHEMYAPQNQNAYQGKAATADILSKQGLMPNDKTALVDHSDDDHCCVPKRTCQLF